MRETSITTMDDGIDELPKLSVRVVKSVVDFPSRVPEADDFLHGDQISLRPCTSNLGPAGRLSAAAEQVHGVWLGSIETNSVQNAAAKLVPLLHEFVSLDGCGAMVDPEVSLSALRFVPSTHDSSGTEEARKLLDGSPTKMQLVGEFGHILSHHVELWLHPTESNNIAVLLRLRTPRRDADKGLGVRRQGPLGSIKEAWEEQPMIDFPRLLGLTTEKGSKSDLAIAPEFWFDAEDKEIKIRCWKRSADSTAVGVSNLVGDSWSLLNVEQLVWCDAISTLAESKASGEEPVPAARLYLADEGVASHADLSACISDASDTVTPEAPWLSSLKFLNHHVNKDLFHEEVFPHLFPEQSGIVRILSAGLHDAKSNSHSKNKGTQDAAAPRRPKSLEEMMEDGLNFRKPSLWSGSDDPLRFHKLTTVFLVNEHSGAMLGFHCLKGFDPYAP